MKILEKIDEYIEVEEDIIDRIFDFIISLEPNQVTEEQADSILEIINIIDPDEDEEIDPEEIEEAFKRRVRRNIKAARKRRRVYRRQRARRRMKARRYRRSAKGKRTARKAKRFKRLGRTSTGKRMRKFIGPKLPRR
jgi:hypothetical protein